MDNAQFAGRIRELAEAEEQQLLNTLPTHPDHKFVLWLEMQRVLDTWTVQRHLANQNVDDAVVLLEILKMGANAATAHLLSPLSAPLGIPLMRITPEMRRDATDVLHAFGRVALARRVSDMVEHEFLVVQENESGLTFRDTGTAQIQFMDHVEADLFSKAETGWCKGDKSPQGWTVLDAEDLRSFDKVGAYLARPSKVKPPELSHEDLVSRMRLLIKPWVTPYGTMMGYGALPELDEHFINAAGPVLVSFRDYAGVHPDAQYGEFTGEQLLAVTLVLLSLHMKHLRFALIAHSHVPEIDVGSSLTIWGPISELAESISDVSGLKLATVEPILRALTLSYEDLPRLRDTLTPLLPLLVDLGNGFCLRPISCLGDNPLSMFQRLASWRSRIPHKRTSRLREDWMRREVYSVFGGNKYSCVEGAIVLREGPKILTDIDAAVFDNATGELALIQLKWQDYATRDVKELVSKSRNFSEEVDAWAEKVNSWIFSRSPQQVAQALRLKLRGPQRVTAVFLFAVSRTQARPHGYGSPVKKPFLSIASWSQFKRVRLQVGPGPGVFNKMHEALRIEEAAALCSIVPIPVSIVLQQVKLSFENLWCKWSPEEVETVRPEVPTNGG